MPEFLSPLELYDEDEPDDVPEAPQEIDLNAMRELVLRAHPDVIPEMVGGDSVASMLESVEPAREAYARLAETWEASRPQAVRIPAGGGVKLPVDPGKLPAAEKIRRGLQVVAAGRQKREG